MLKKFFEDRKAKRGIMNSKKHVMQFLKGKLNIRDISENPLYEHLEWTELDTSYKFREFKLEISKLNKKFYLVKVIFNEVFIEYELKIKFNFLSTKITMKEVEIFN